MNVQVFALLDGGHNLADIRVVLDDRVAHAEILQGDFVPDGLMDEDARCFNLENDDAHMRDYIMARLAEAARNADKNVE